MYGYDSALMDRRDDARLADRLLERDESALSDAIAAFGPVVYGVARRVLGDVTHAEEVAQDTFIALWRRPGAFDPARGSLQTFLASVARNKAVDLVRKEESRRRTRDALISEAEAEGTSAEASTAELIEERHQIKAALAKLTPVQREAVVLAYFGGRTYRQVAEELGIPEGTAKTRLRDALTRLRELIGSEQ